MHDAEPAAVGAGLLGPEGRGLLLEEDGQGAGGAAGGRRRREVLHGFKIDLRAGSLVAEGVARDDFAPLGSKVADFLEVLRGKLTAWHGLSCLVLTMRSGDAFLLLLYASVLRWAKLFMASGPRSFTPHLQFARSPGIIGVV
jgi:hypothetical protein